MHGVSLLSLVRDSQTFAMDPDTPAMNQTRKSVAIPVTVNVPEASTFLTLIISVNFIIYLYIGLLVLEFIYFTSCGDRN